MLTGLSKIKGKTKKLILGIQEYIDDLLENEIKIIVFAHHKDVLDHIEKFVINIFIEKKGK
jgi:hypothetical protein